MVEGHRSRSYPDPILLHAPSSASRSSSRSPMSLPAPASSPQAPPRRQRAASAGAPRTPTGCPRTHLKPLSGSQTSHRSIGRKTVDGLENCDHAPHSLDGTPIPPPTIPRTTEPEEPLATSLYRSRSTSGRIESLSAPSASGSDFVKKEPDCKREVGTPRAEGDSSKAKRDAGAARPTKTGGAGEEGESIGQSVLIKTEKCSESEEDPVTPLVARWSVDAIVTVTEIKIEDESEQGKEANNALDRFEATAVHQNANETTTVKQETHKTTIVAQTADETTTIQHDINETTTVKQENSKTTTRQQDVTKTISVHRDADETTAVRVAEANKTTSLHQAAEISKCFVNQASKTSEEAREFGPSGVHWKETDTGSQALSRILPFNTVKRLIDDPGRCAASITRERSRRCLNTTKWSQGLNAKVLDCISELRHPVARSDALKHIELLVSGVLCTKGQHRKIASTALAKLRTSFEEHSWSPEKSKYRAEFSSADTAAFPAWVRALTDANLDVDAANAPSAFSQVDSKLVTKIQIMSDRHMAEARTSGIFSGDRSSLTYTSRQLRSMMVTNSVTSTGIQQFIPYRTKRTSKPVSDLLRETLEKSLTSRAKTDGLIYMYWYPGNFGYIKIGYTGRKTISKRLAEWKRQCKHEAQPHWTSEMQSAGRVPHVYRVEALVHAELNDYRFQEKCKGCGKNHIEWFRVTVEMARRVIEKWSNWMIRKQPYGVGGVGSPLKQSIGDSDVLELCQPLALETDASKKSAQGGQNNKPKQAPTQKRQSVRKQKETQSLEAVRKQQAAQQESAVQEQEDALKPEAVAKEGAPRKIRTVRKPAEIRRREAVQKQRAVREQDAVQGSADIQNRVAKRMLEDVVDNAPHKVIVVNRLHLSIGSTGSRRSGRTGSPAIAW